MRLTEKFEGGTKTSDVGGSLLCGSNPEKYKTRPLASYFTDTVTGCRVPCTLTYNPSTIIILQ